MSFAPIHKWSHGHTEGCPRVHSPCIFVHVHNTHWGFPGGSEGKESACSVGDLGLNPGSGRSPGKGNGNPLQYSCLENSVDGGAWWATVYGVAESSCSAASFIPPIVSLCISFSPLFHLLSSLPLSPFLPSFLFYLPSLFKPFNSCVVIMFCALNFHFWCAAVREVTKSQTQLSN